MSTTTNTGVEEFEQEFTGRHHKRPAAPSVEPTTPATPADLNEGDGPMRPHGNGAPEPQKAEPVAPMHPMGNGAPEPQKAEPVAAELNR